MQCDMCGKESNLLKVDIEGTILNVCRDCASFGKIIREPKLPPKRYIKRKTQNQKEYIVKSSYSSLIRKARENMNLTQEQFAKKINEKESLVNHMEVGKFSPSVSLAKKLEKLLKISLLEEIESKEVEQKSSKQAPLTIGDMIKIKE